MKFQKNETKMVKDEINKDKLNINEMTIKEKNKKNSKKITKKKIAFKFEKSSIIKNINLGKPITEFINEICKDFKFVESSFLSQATLKLNVKGDHISNKEFCKIWSDLDFDYENINEIEIIEKKENPIEIMEILSIIIIDNSGKNS